MLTRRQPPPSGALMIREDYGHSGSDRRCQPVSKVALEISPVAANEGGADRKGRYQPRNGSYGSLMAHSWPTKSSWEKPHKLVNACRDPFYTKAGERTRTVNLLLTRTMPEGPIPVIFG